MQVLLYKGDGHVRATYSSSSQWHVVLAAATVVLAAVATA